MVRAGHHCSAGGSGVLRSGAAAVYGGYRGYWYRSEGNSGRRAGKDGGIRL